MRFISNLTIHRCRCEFHFDNRSRDYVRVEKVFLRIYANGAPIWIIMWNRGERISNEFKEVDFTIGKTLFTEGKRIDA